jgi:hypothetical protein
MNSQQNSLKSTYPELCNEWHYEKNGELLPQNIKPKSGKKVWWICNQGHEWQTKICTRTSQSTGCPYCSGKYATKENNLTFTFPDVAREWCFQKNGGLLPEDVKPQSGRKVWWKCKKGHEWQARIADRTRGSICPFCSGRKATNENNLAMLNHDLTKQWHPNKNELTPYDVKLKSKKKVWWMCNRGHEWQATVKNRANGSGCPYCSTQTSDLEIRILCELKTIFPNILWRGRIEGIECDVYLPRKKLGIEVDGYFWHKEKISEDKKKNDKLKKLGIILIRLREKNLPLISEDDILFKNEPPLEIVKRLLIPLQKYSTNRERKDISIYFQQDRLRNEEEHKKLLSFLPSPPSENSLSTLNPKLATEWNYSKNLPLTPEMFGTQSDKKVWWICKKGHEWLSSIGNRHRGTGCPYCAKRLSSKENNFALKYPELVKEWHKEKNINLLPENITPKSSKKVWWICHKGHEWQAKVSGRARGFGCPYCSGRKPTSTNNFGVCSPELLKQWDFNKNTDISPYNIPPHSRRKVWWVCKKGHKWIASISSRSGVNNTGCPYCTGKKVCHDNNLAENRREIAKEWNYQKNADLTPEDVTYGSKKKVWWICHKGHEWQAKINNRTSSRSGCPICANKKRAKNLNKTKTNQIKTRQ